ncbi:MAG: Na+/H+ antiporter subunit E [Desulfobulbus sp.]|jgi:multicomponent K+:H+ antiporter subunit E
MKSTLVWTVLLLRFLWAVLISGVQTLIFILAHALGRPTPPAGFVEIAFPPLRLEGVTLLAWMISLTPGTTVIHVDQTQRIFRLHMLNMRNQKRTINGIQKRFFANVIFLFGTEQA